MGRHQPAFSVGLAPRHWAILDVAAERYTMSRSALVRRILDQWAGIEPCFGGGFSERTYEQWKEKLSASLEEGEDKETTEETTDEPFDEPEKDTDYDLGLEGGSVNEALEDDEDDFELPEDPPF